MHSSWQEHRSACAGCRSVESHLFMEGGFVCEWQVASCSEGSPSAKHVRTHSRVDTLQDLIKRIAGAAPAALNKRLTFFIGDIWRESPLPYPRMIVFGILAMVLQGLSMTMGSIGRPPWTTKIWLKGLITDTKYCIYWFHTHTAYLKRMQTVVTAWSLFHGLLGLERITSINQSTSKWLAHKSRLVSSFPSLDLVPIFHDVPKTQLSLAFDKTSIEMHPLRHSVSGMELGNNRWPDRKMYHSLKLHLIK